MLQIAIDWMERGLLPDAAVRFGIRRLLRQRLQELREAGSDGQQRFLASLREGPIAQATEQANRQHYEVPAAFFRQIMGKHMKYSACLWEPPVETLDEAEAAMLALTCRRAGLADGQRILELGCGWGSLSLWMARQYPGASILAMSNSHGQRAYIEAEAARQGLSNLRVVTEDINRFEPEPGFDRIVSVEMFEHLHNYQALFRRLAGWLRDDGQMFLHVFSHRQYAYPFETEGEDNWMGRYFFTGGLMPSEDLFERVQDEFVVSARWRVNGLHYAKTCEAWLQNQDRNGAAIKSLFAEVYGADAERWFHRWRVFFMACAELFAYRGGEEWGVTHCLLEKAQSASS